MTSLPPTPVVWIDPDSGAFHCVCGWMRPSGRDFAADVRAAEAHAGTCGKHIAYAHELLSGISWELGVSHVPEEVMDLLHRLIDEPQPTNARRTIQRWLDDLYSFEDV